MKKFYSTLSGRTYTFVEKIDDGKIYVGELDAADGESLPSGLYRVPAQYVRSVEL